MKQRKLCNPEDMVTFLLALCCQDDPPKSAVSRDKDLVNRFDDCHRSVIPIANDVGLRNRLAS